MTDQPNHDFYTFLRTKQPELVQTISDALQAEVSFYAPLDGAVVQRTVNTSIDTLLQGWQAQDTSTMINTTVRGILGGVKYGLRLDEALHIISVFRQHLTHYTLQALQQSIADATQGLRFYSDALDQAVERIGGFYYDQLQDSQLALAQFRLVVENALDAVVMFDLDGTITYANPATQSLLGFADRHQILGYRTEAFFQPNERERFRSEVWQALKQHGMWHGRMWLQPLDHKPAYCDVMCFLVRDEHAQVLTTCAVVRDITADHVAQQQRDTMNARLLEMQEQALAELAAPTIPLTNQSLMLPIIGQLDDQRMQRIAQTLLAAVANKRVHVVIVDVTGVPSINANGGKGLIAAAQAVRLLGAQFVLTGIHPDVAQTLISLGVDFAGITTRARLQDGIALVLAQKI